MATTTQKIFGSFTSNGVAFDLQLPIQTVQTSPGGQIATTTTQPSLMKFICWNYTEWATTGKVIRSTYLKGFTAGVALQETTTTATNTNITPTIESTNGFTLINNTPKYGVEITAITKANPGVATFRGPGWTQNQIYNPGISNFATGDLIVFNSVAGSSGTSWSGLNFNTSTNPNPYTLTLVTSNTFSFNVDTSAYTGTYTASSGIARRTVDAGGNKIPPINMANVGIRLGTAVVGAQGDVVYYEAELSDEYQSLGQL